MVRDSFYFYNLSGSSGSAIGSAYHIINPSPITAMYISIANASGSRTLYFEGQGPTAGSYISLFSQNLSTGSYATLTAGTADELWKVNLAGLSYLRCRITETSGSLTVLGRVIE